MAKYQNDSLLNAALAVVKSSGDNIYVCSSQPTTYLQATSTYALTAGITLSLYGSITSGDVSGRKLPVLAQSSINVTSTGAAAHIAIVNASPATLLFVTTLASTVSVTASGSVNITTWDIEFLDVTP